MTASSPEPPESDRTPVRRHHWLVRTTHWVSALLFPAMIASGLQIYAAFPHFGQKSNVFPLPNPFDSDRFGGMPEWVRLGGWLAGGINWHFALAWPFVLTGLAYLIYLGVSGSGAPYCFARATFHARGRCSSTT